MICRAADGSEPDRAAFGERYLPIVRAYFEARWQGTPLVGDVDDAVQELFVDCYRPGGLLAKAEPSRKSGFRSFLFGSVRYIALRFERRTERRTATHEDDVDFTQVPTNDDPPSRAFQRAWAETLVDVARKLQERRAGESGPEGEQRVVLLRLRFEQGIPIREIAKRWHVDADALHRVYARARRDFHQALRDVVAYHVPDRTERVDEECQELLRLLG